MILGYNDDVTLYAVTSDEYGRKKIITDSNNIECIFLQNIQVIKSDKAETIQADAVMYPDPEDEYLESIAYRLEGMYVKANIYDDSDNESWYVITEVTINRDHLIDNQIDNILCILSKSDSLPLVS